MKVDIWSDVMCPFCYIGKRHFEEALSKFPNHNEVEVEWHSFQLDPDMEYQEGKNIYQYLAERKGQSYEWSVKMHEHVVNMAKQVGLEYNFDKAIVANSFDAHRLIQLAKQRGLGEAAEERIFKAYFTEGKNMGDYPTLIALGKDIGLDEKEVNEMLNSGAMGNEVAQDIQRSAMLGIRGVPFFVMDNKYGISGAQPSSVFQQALTQAFKEWKEAVKS